MARLKKARKPSEEGIPKTLYMRRGIVARAQRQARREVLSLSAFVEATLREKLDAVAPLPVDRREGERRAS